MHIRKGEEKKMYKLEYKLDCKKKAIGARIAEERKKLGLTQDELSEKIFLGRIAVSQIETGKKLPNTKTATLLCELFNCEMAYLWCEIDTKKYETTDICKTTNLSESAVQNIIDLNKIVSKPLFQQPNSRTEELKTFENLICNPNFRFLLKSIANYKSKYLNFIKEKSIAKKNELKLSNYKYDEDISELKNKLDFALFQLQQDFVTLVNTSDED